MQKELELRMYSLVLYNISEIQKSIQAGHAVEEFSDKYGTTKEYKKYRKYKTWIVLNGGTSNSGKESYYGLEPMLGSMEQHLQLLKNNDINHAPFYEPDLNYALTAIAFIVDERVFNRDDYPDFKNYIINNLTLTSPQIELQIKICTNEQLKSQYSDLYQNWLKLIGGKKNEFLKEFLTNKRFA